MQWISRKSPKPRPRRKEEPQSADGESALAGPGGFGGAGDSGPELGSGESELVPDSGNSEFVSG